jgi:hypothetical protein
MVEITLKPDKSAFIRKSTIKVFANISTPTLNRMFLVEQRRYNLGDERSKLKAEENAINCIINKTKKEKGTINQLKVGKNYLFGYHYTDKICKRWV